MNAGNGTEEATKVKIGGPDDFDNWLKTRHLFVIDKTTGKRELELVTYLDFIDAYKKLEENGKYLWMEHPYDGLAKIVHNLESNVRNQASALEARTTRAVVTDEALRAEVGTAMLTPLCDGHSVKFYKVTKSGRFCELIEVDGMAMNRRDRVLVVNEAKMSPSDKDIAETQAKELKLQGWLHFLAKDPDRYATKPACVKDQLLGIDWKVHTVLSGDNFAAEIEEECNEKGLFVVRPNGLGYGYTRASSASSATTESGSPSRHPAAGYPWPTSDSPYASGSSSASAPPSPSASSSSSSSPVGGTPG